MLHPEKLQVLSPPSVFMRCSELDHHKLDHRNMFGKD